MRLIKLPLTLFFLLFLSGCGSDLLILEDNFNLSAFNFSAFNTTVINQTSFVRQDCATNEIIKWDGTTWICATDNSGGGGGSANFEDVLYTNISYVSGQLTNVSDVTATKTIFTEIIYSGDDISAVTINNGTTTDTGNFTYSSGELVSIVWS